MEGFPARPCTSRVLRACLLPEFCPYSGAVLIITEAEASRRIWPHSSPRPESSGKEGRTEAQKEVKERITGREDKVAEQHVKRPGGMSHVWRALQGGWTLRHAGEVGRREEGKGQMWKGLY